MTTQQESTRKLSGSLGVGSIVFMVVAAAAPLTVIAGTVPLGIAIGNGPAFPATFALSAVVLLLFAVGFCAMSPHVPNAGAFYAYVERGLGRVAGLGTAFLALATYTAVQLAVYGYLGAVIDGLVQNYGGPALPWWLWSVLVLAVVGVLGYRRIELSSRVLGVLLVCEVAIVLVFDAVVAGTGGAGGAGGASTALLVPSQIGSGSLGVALMFAVAGFIGFEATAVFRDEARDPSRTIPRATYTALVLIGVFYTVSGWAVVTAWGDAGAVAAAGADPGGMLITTITNYLGTVGGDLAQVLLVTSLFAAALSFHNVLARYFFALGSAGALPAACSRTRDGAPHVASMAQSASALVLVALFAAIGLDPVTQVFAWMAGTATLGVLALMALTCLAVLVYFRRTQIDTRPWQTMVAPALGFAGLLAFLWLTITNFPTLIGGSAGLATAIGAVLVVFFAAGAVWSRRSSAAVPAIV